jgi:hypothetical protein
MKGYIMTKRNIYTMSFAKVYPLLVAKAEKKGRTKMEVDLDKILRKTNQE